MILFPPIEYPPFAVSVELKAVAEIELVAVKLPTVRLPSNQPSPLTDNFLKGEVVPIPTFPFKIVFVIVSAPKTTELLPTPVAL